MREEITIFESALGSFPTLLELEMGRKLTDEERLHMDVEYEKALMDYEGWLAGQVGQIA